MLRNKVLLSTLLKQKFPSNINIISGYSSLGGMHDEKMVVGNREWVGYGAASTPHYEDRVDIPLPAVRFKEITGELVALKEKEKGDWKKLTIEEKKKLYRASFRQTFAEINAPTGEWKSITGWTLFFVGIALWVYILEKKFIINELPETFSQERREAQLRKMLVNKDGHITGISSKWDYEKDDWK